LLTETKVKVILEAKKHTTDIEWESAGDEGGAQVAQAGMQVARMINNTNPPSMKTCSTRVESNSQDI